MSKKMPLPIRGGFYRSCGLNPACFPIFLGLLVYLLTSAVPAFALPPRPVISEVMVDVSGPESDSELVELYNPTGQVWNIGGWDIAYKTATGSSWSAVATIPAGETIPPYGYYLVGGDKVTPPPDYVDTSMGFASAGGHIALRDSQNNIVDKVGYGTALDPEGGAAPPAPGTDDSLERLPGANDPTKGNGQDSENNLADFLLRTMPEPQNSEGATETPDYNAGTIDLERVTFATLAETSNIAVTDSDLNNRSTVAETFYVRIASVADTAGISLRLQETGLNASTFDAISAGTTLGLTVGASQASAGLLKVRASGDTLTTSYCDSAPYQTVTDQATFAGITQVKINEVGFDPVGADAGNEWIELYNAGGAAVDVSGWTLTDEDASVVMTMPALTVPAHNFIVWHIDQAGTDDTDFSDSVAHIYSGETTTVSLANTEDQVSLYASTTRDANTIVDFVAYVADGFYNSPEDDNNAVAAGIWPSDASVNIAGYAEGASLCIKPDGDDHNLPADWEMDNSPTPGTSNSIVSPPGAPGGLAAVPGDERIDLSWTAATVGDLPLAGYNVYRRTTGDSYTTPINDTLIILTEYADTGVSNGTTYYYVVRAMDVGSNQGDSSSEVSATPQAPPPPGTSVAINEIMYDPAYSEPEWEWVELYNPTGGTVSVAGWTFTDGEGIYTIPVGTTIEANDYLVLGNTALAAGGPDLIYGPYDTGTISFANTADNVILKSDTGALIDEVDYTSYWGGAAPKSLSRKYAGLDANDFTNWAKSQADSGTPGAVNDCDTVPPQIYHTPVTVALEGNDLAIHATASDTAGWYTAKESWVYYRTTGETAYTQLVMNGIYDNYAAIIPGSAVTLTGVDYYIVIMDESNNTASKPENTPETTPYTVTVWPDTYQVVVNEIMYDPPENEPQAEWVELYNCDTTSSIDLGGWTFTDGEGAYTIPFGTVLAADSYLVLAYSDSAAGGKGDLFYGDSMTGQIILSNVFGLPGADQVTLQLENGLVIDEVDYNVEWGAANGNGPNDNTLEKLTSSGPANDGSNWSYTMIKGGTPGAPNSTHLVWDVWADPTELDLTTGETSSIRYRLSEGCTVTITVYDEAYSAVRTLVAWVWQEADTYWTSWDGKNGSGETVAGVCTFEIAAVNAAGKSSVSKCNDAQMIALEHAATPDMYRAWAGEFPTINYYLSKPARVTFNILNATTGLHIATFIDSEAQGQGEHHRLWEGRSDSGVLHDGMTTPSLNAMGIEGHAIVARSPLAVSSVHTSPVAYFEPALGDTQAISYHLNRGASVTISIFTQRGVYVKDLVTSQTQVAGVNAVNWDGRDAGGAICANGIYVFKITALAGTERAIRYVDVCVYEF